MKWYHDDPTEFSKNVIQVDCLKSNGRLFGIIKYSSNLRPLLDKFDEIFSESNSMELLKIIL